MGRGTRIAVLGAGLAGLTVAGLLQRAGFSVAVYEQSPGFSRIGAGIILGANVAKVLRRLELEQAFATTGIRPDAFVSRAWDSGETLYRLAFDAACEARFGGPFVNIHRADLHQLLQQPLRPGTIRYGHKLVGIEETAHGVTLSFDNGATAEADIAIGADGIRSRTREIMLGADEPRFIGRTAPRAVLPASRIKGEPIGDCTKWWAADRHVLAYYMTARRDEVYVMAALPAERWVLMGDACHAVRPFMAAGGSMAIEDAAILSRCILEFADPPTAFARYAAIRIPRVAEVQQISIDNTWMHGPTETDWFFGYDPCSVPLDDTA